MLALVEQKVKIGLICLRRMYLKWFDKKKFDYEIISEHKGEEAGIKSINSKSRGCVLIWAYEI